MPMMPITVDTTHDKNEEVIRKVQVIAQWFIKTFNERSSTTGTLMEYEPQDIERRIKGIVKDEHPEYFKDDDVVGEVSDVIRYVVDQNILPALRTKMIERMYAGGNAGSWSSVVRPAYMYDQSYIQEGNQSLVGQRMSAKGRELFENIPLNVAMDISDDERLRAREVARMALVIGADRDGETFRVTSESIDYQRLNDAAQSNIALTEAILTKVDLRAEDLHDVNLRLDQWRNDPAHQGQLDDPSETIVLRMFNPEDLEQRVRDRALDPERGKRSEAREARLDRQDPEERWPRHLKPATFLDQKTTTSDAEGRYRTREGFIMQRQSGDKEKWATNLQPAVILEQEGLSSREKADKILYEMERGDQEQWVLQLRPELFMEQTGSVGSWRGVVPQFSEVGKILLSRIPENVIVAIPGKGRDRDGSTDRMLRIIGLTDGLRGATERADTKVNVDFKNLNNAAELNLLLVETILGRVDFSSDEISDLNAGLKQWREDERQRQKQWEEYHREPARTKWVSDGDITLTPITRQEDLKK